MILVDANVLLYAWDASSVHHSAARDWLGTVISESRPLRLAWPVIIAFLRISTNFRIVTNPLTAQEACDIISHLLDQPSVGILQPGPQHWEILTRVLAQSAAQGPLIMDAHLAAMAMEHGATICTHDRDFVRFPGLRVEFPLA